MDAKWRFCTRPVCRLRSDVSRNRQIYTRKRKAIGGEREEDAVSEHDYLHPAPEKESGAPLPGRYCAGLCEPEPPPERTLPGPAKKPLKK